MSDVLSQAEIDALKAAVKDGSAMQTPSDKKESDDTRAQVRVVDYDFRKPRLISADQVHTIRLAHETMSKNLQTALYGLLKTPVEVKLVALDQISCGEFVLSLTNPTLLVRFNWGETGVFASEVALPIGLCAVDILLGGDGAIPEGSPRELTRLERKIFDRVTDVFAAELRAAWAIVAEVEIKPDGYEVNPECLQMAPPETPCLNVTYDVKIGNVSGGLNICYPLDVVQAAVKRASGTGTARRCQDSGIDMLKAVEPVPLRFRACVGSSSVLARELAALKPGDVIRMDRRAGAAFTGVVGQVPMFETVPGRRRGRTVVQVVRCLRQDEGVAATAGNGIKAQPQAKK